MNTIADRLAAIKQLDDFARSAGVTCSTSHENRTVYTHMAHPSGLCVGFTLRPKSAIVISWHTSLDFQGRLDPAVLTAVNPYHGCKATDIADTLPGAVEILRRVFAAADDGSAFAKP